jgi:hypothetical protein
MRGIMRGVERKPSDFLSLAILDDPGERMLKAQLDQETSRCERTAGARDRYPCPSQWCASSSDIGALTRRARTTPASRRIESTLAAARAVAQVAEAAQRAAHEHAQSELAELAAFVAAEAPPPAPAAAGGGAAKKAPPKAPPPAKKLSKAEQEAADARRAVLVANAASAEAAALAAARAASVAGAKVDGLEAARELAERAYALGLETRLTRHAFALEFENGRIALRANEPAAHGFSVTPGGGEEEAALLPMGDASDPRAARCRLRPPQRQPPWQPSGAQRLVAAHAASGVFTPHATTTRNLMAPNGQSFITLVEPNRFRSERPPSRAASAGGFGGGATAAASPPRSQREGLLFSNAAAPDMWVRPDSAPAGAQRLLSAAVSAPALSRPGTAMGLSRSGTAASLSRPGTANAASRPGTALGMSRPGTANAASRPGTAPGMSRPGTANAASRPGTAPGMSRPGTAGAASERFGAAMELGGGGGASQRPRSAASTLFNSTAASRTRLDLAADIARLVRASHSSRVTRHPPPVMHHPLFVTRHT